MTAAQQYRTYISDDTLSPLSDRLIEEILNENPLHVLDFGSGSGKHCNILNRKGIVTIAIDISMMNTVRAHSKYDLPFVACTDQSYLGHFCNVDVVTTCSVLDHIEDIEQIISHFKRIANKSIIIAETNDVPSELYYPHDYEGYGFRAINFKWESTLPEGDGATYHLWKWTKWGDEMSVPNDDLAI